MKSFLNFEWLAWFSAETAKNIFIVIFLVIGILVWLLPQDYIYEGLDNPRWWHNLKLWATGVLTMIIVTYLIF